MLEIDTLSRLPHLRKDQQVAVPVAVRQDISAPAKTQSGPAVSAKSAQCFKKSVDVGNLERDSESHREAAANTGSYFQRQAGRDGVTIKGSGDEWRDISAPRRVLNLFCDLLEDGKMCDLKIQTADKPVNAHKIIFMAYSDSLATYFTERPTQQTALLDLSDTASDVVWNIVDFLYTEDITINDKNVGDVLRCSLKLDIKILADICMEYLSHFTVENALRFYVICQRCDVTFLAARIWRYICENFEKVSQAESFLECSFPIVLSLLSDDRIKIESEVCVLQAAERWVEHLHEERQDFASVLLGCVRLSQVSPQDLIKRLDSKFGKSPRCAKLLFHAVCFHGLKENGSARADELSVKPRNGPVKGCDFSKIPKIISEDPKAMIETVRHCPATSKVDTVTARNVTQAEQPSTAVASKEEKVTVDSASSKGCMTSTEKQVTGRASETSIKTSLLVLGGHDIDAKPVEGKIPGKNVTKFDGKSEQWKMMADIKEGTHHHTAVVLNGKLYLIGGSAYNAEKELFRPTSNVYVCDLVTMKWSSGVPMQEARSSHGCVVHDGKIYVVGGWNSNNLSLDTIEQYDPATERWTVIERIPGGGRLGAAVAILHNNMYIVGGYDKNLANPVLRSVHRLDMQDFTWHTHKPLRVPCCHAALVTVENEMFLIGGRVKYRGMISLNSVLRYDPSDEDWAVETTMAGARHNVSVAVAGDRIFILGGLRSPSRSSLKTVECYDVANRCWVNDIQELPYGVTGAAVVAVQNSPKIL